MTMVYIIDSNKQSRQRECLMLKSCKLEIKEFKSSQEAISSCEFDIKCNHIPQLIIQNVYDDADKNRMLSYMRENIITQHIPVIVISATDSELDRTKAFDMDASAYIVKPIKTLSFIAQIQSLIRRNLSHDSLKLMHKGIVLDDSRHIVLSDGVLCDLTLKEYEILKYFLNHVGLIVKKDDLLKAVWNGTLNENHTVSVHINSLRNKLGTSGKVIKTLRNIGYKME
jgi:two-component system alkaline phosphatase synthesis response regulator PhoP